VSLLLLFAVLILIYNFATLLRVGIAFEVPQPKFSNLRFQVAGYRLYLQTNCYNIN